MGGSQSKKDSRTHQSANRKSNLDFSLFEARVDRVDISGLKRTHDDYIQRVPNKLYNVKTFEELLLECERTRNYLIDLGIYKDLHVLIDTSKGRNSVTPNGYDITFSGTELLRFTGALGTEIGQNDGSATFELSMPNLFGRGERATLSGSYSTLSSTNTTISFNKPYLHTKYGDNKPELSCHLFRNVTRVYERFYRTDETGFMVDASFLLPLDVKHSFQYEASTSALSILGRQAPFFVREMSGVRLGSIFRYTCSHDQRDNPVFPTTGIYCRLTSVLAGFGGDIGYMSISPHAELNVPLFAGLSLQMCGRMGVIHQNNKYPKIPINFLYTLGGPQTVRGFHMAGIGTHVDGAPIGAHTFWASGLHLWGPLPFSSYFGELGKAVRTHLFYNMGNCGGISEDNWRSAYGAGLAIKLGAKARVEINYCFPLRKQPGDRAKPGFQFGIGYDFL